MALTKIKTSNLETSIDLTGINDTATSQILTVSDTGIDVTGTVTADGLEVTNGNPSITIKDSNNTKNQTGYVGVIISKDSADTDTWAIGRRFGSTALKIENKENSSTIFETNSTERMRIDSSGNVGIGVTPESWLSFISALQIGGNGSLSCDTPAGAGKTLSLGNNVYHDGARKYISTDEASRYDQDSGTHKFYVAPSGTANTAISWTTAMTIDNAAGVDISSNSSGVALNVEHNVAGQYTAYFKNSNADGPVLNLEHPNTADQTIVSFRNGNGEVGRIRTNGSATSYNTSSDYRLKENVVPMTGSIDRVKALNPSRFNFIADPDTTVDGFLAHEAQEVVPEAISGEKDAMKTEEYEVTPAVKDENDNIITEAVMGTREIPDMQGIDQAKLVPLLVGALQEQQTLIESLTTRLEALEGV